jgi:C4-type Zn-finger protein
MEQLKEELATSVEEGKLKDSDIATYQGLLSRSELDKLSLEEQNAELHKQISKLKDIKLSSMEDKLNRTIEMLLSLQESVVENRAISYAVGDTICGREMFKEFVDRAKEELKHE